MAPSITKGAVISSRRSPATKVRVFQVQAGRARSTARRAGSGLAAGHGRFTQVSSMKTSRAGSNRPCSRIQCRRARATSARCCSAARRLFFEADVVTVQKTPERAAAARHSLLVQGRDELFERPIRPLADQREDPVRVVLQRRSAAAAWPRHVPFPAATTEAI